MSSSVAELYEVGNAEYNGERSTVSFVRSRSGRYSVEWLYRGQSKYGMKF